MIEILHPVDDRARIDQLASTLTTVDAWDDALDELGALNRFDHQAPPIPPDLDEISRYVHYPWRGVLVRLPDSPTFLRMRTARNRLLITDDEQAVWSSSLIAVAGLSVGAALLHTCSMTGARRFHVADPDVLGLTNLNRLAGSVCDLGVSKAVLAQRRILETDPYSDVTPFPDGFTADAASGFLGAPEPVGVVLEEVDDLAAKVEIRRRARERGIPVVMVTDDGDGVIVDVERYDLEPDYPLFHGRADGIERLGADELRDPQRRIALVTAIVGDDIGERTRAALGQVGRTIPTWPQLGTASTLAGAAGAAVARAVVCGVPVPSGRRSIRLDDLSAASLGG
ncbi:ThiF family adenylyltransferase [Gordonia crocea]|uniref:THIF-type NAD/FAD binding fold domain-containing protein n=1 Tax=Gordonia crocea TaxID=589162 RepID=A0A7M4BQ04_9ACTN|nr:ThiF family adenylyltransferase [Gordonia crocea]GED95965.1 hypothetical protein nbrc107697_00040 [Gordonia crocea]